MDRNELPLQPHHLGVPSSASKTIAEPMVRSAHTVYLSCTDTNIVSRMDRNKSQHDPRHLGVPSVASKMISKPMVHSAQTVHLSCVRISTISKWTEMSYHLSLITKEYHRVRPKRFLTPWYVWHKPCNYLALTRILSPNGPKQDLTLPMSSCNCIGCVQIEFRAYGMFAQNRTPILRQD
jgi:hypothetical protein